MSVQSQDTWDILVTDERIDIEKKLADDAVENEIEQRRL